MFSDEHGQKYHDFEITCKMPTKIVSCKTLNYKSSNKPIAVNFEKFVFQDLNSVQKWFHINPKRGVTNKDYPFGFLEKGFQIIGRFIVVKIINEHAVSGEFFRWIKVWLNVNEDAKIRNKNITNKSIITIKKESFKLMTHWMPKALIKKAENII